MKKSALLIIGLLGVGVAAFAAKANNVKATIKQIVVSFSGIKYVKEGSNVLQTKLLLTINVFNPNYTPLTFESFTGSLLYNGRRISSFAFNAMGRNIKILMGNNLMDADILLSHVSLALEAKDLIQKLIKKQPIGNIVIDGYVKAGGISMPITQTITLPAIAGISNTCNCN